MARVTVEDCIKRVPNRFELVLLAVQRARDIGTGAHLSVIRDSDKNSVIALREIAERRVNHEQLWEELRVLLSPRQQRQEEEMSEAEALFAPSGDKAKASDPDGGEETGEKTWSEEDMLRALQEMEGGGKQPA